MQERSARWSVDGSWKKRYSKLYSSRGISLSPNYTKNVVQDSRSKYEPSHVSFMTADSAPYTSVLQQQARSDSSTMVLLNKDTSQSSTLYSRNYSRLRPSYQDTNGTDTKLLNMVRAHNRSYDFQKNFRNSLKLSQDRQEDDERLDETCMHGMNMRLTERSVSRSRVSRISTRRDYDIPSILAFTSNAPPATVQAHLEIPAFQRAAMPNSDQIPRWSIRRSICPVCSQKWKDNSFIRKIKYSGLKRNSTLELPSVIAPARLRTSIRSGYVPRPLLTVDNDDRSVYSSFRNSGAAWQLTRARRFRIPKPVMPPPEATAPPSITAPAMRKDLDSRVSKFLKN